MSIPRKSNQGKRKVINNRANENSIDGLGHMDEDT